MNCAHPLLCLLSVLLYLHVAKEPVLRQICPKRRNSWSGLLVIGRDDMSGSRKAFFYFLFFWGNAVAAKVNLGLTVADELGTSE